MRPISSAAPDDPRQGSGRFARTAPHASPPPLIFDDVTGLAARSFAAPICLISLADGGGRRIRSAHGIELGDTRLDDNAFSRALSGEETIVVPDTLADPVLRDSPLVTGTPCIRFYAAAPLDTPSAPGTGALCIADYRPRTLSPHEREMLRGFARLAVCLLETGEQSRALENTRAELKRLTEFNAVLAKVARVVGTSRSPRELLHAVCDITVRHAEAKVAYIARPADTDRFEFIAASGATDYLDDLTISTDPDVPEGQGYAARAWNSGLAHFAADIVRESPLRPWRDRARAFGLKSTAILPIFRNAQIWAIFTVSFGQDVPFNLELRKLLDELALDISRGLGRLDLIAHEARVTTLHRTLLDNTLAGIALLENRRILSANRRMVEMLGYKDETQLIGQSTRILYQTESEYQRLGELYPDIDRTGSAVALNVDMRKADGSAVVCDVSAGNCSGEGAATTVWTFIDVSERQRLHRQLEYQAHHDALTKLPNRRALEEYFPKVKAHADRDGTFSALGVIDLDDFKSVNDKYGHDVGDQLLEALSRRLKEEIRESDFLVRYGGDEFILLIDQLDPDDLDGQLETIAHRIHQAVAEPFHLGSGERLPIGLSMGLSIYPRNGCDFRELLRTADTALGSLKNAKSSRAQWWSIYAPSAGQHHGGSAATGA